MLFENVHLFFPCVYARRTLRLIRVQSQRYSGDGFPTPGGTRKGL